MEQVRKCWDSTRDKNTLAELGTRMNEALQMLQLDVMLTKDIANVPTPHEIHDASQAVAAAASKDEAANQQLRERIEQAGDLEALSEDERDALVDGLPFDVPPLLPPIHRHKHDTHVCGNI